MAAAAAAAFGGLRQLTGCAGRNAPSPVTAPSALKVDPDGILSLPPDFRYTAFSRTGERMDDGLMVPAAHDGMAAFPGPDGRTLLVRNHELTPGELILGGPFGPANRLLSKVPREMLFDFGGGRVPGLGGTTTLLYNTKDQSLERHHLSLAGTWRNCAGGPTPWGSWITCEETVQRAKDPVEQDHGWCFEVPASAPGLVKPEPLKAMGRFNHEAVAVDPRSGCLYLTEDRGEKRTYLKEEEVGGKKPAPKPEDLGGGLLYRFIPAEPGRLARGGRLQALKIRDRASCVTSNYGSGRIAVGEPLDVVWIDLSEVDSPKDDLRQRGRTQGAAIFTRGEGIWTGAGALWFVCTDGGARFKGQVWKYTPSPDEGTAAEERTPGRLELFIEPNNPSLLENGDNITVAPWGDLILCEDGPGPNHIVGVTPKGKTYLLARNELNLRELAGCTFSPDGTTLFANIQRPGITVAITGPFQKYAVSATL